MSEYDKESRSIWGTHQVCSMCDRRLSIKVMNVPNRIARSVGNIIKPSKLRGMMFICDDCKDNVMIPIKPKLHLCSGKVGSGRKKE